MAVWVGGKCMVKEIWKLEKIINNIFLLMLFGVIQIRVRIVCSIRNGLLLSKKRIFVGYKKIFDR